MHIKSISLGVLAIINLAIAGCTSVRMHNPPVYDFVHRDSGDEQPDQSILDEMDLAATHFQLDDSRDDAGPTGDSHQTEGAAQDQGDGFRLAFDSDSLFESCRPLCIELREGGVTVDVEERATQFTVELGEYTLVFEPGAAAHVAMTDYGVGARVYQGRVMARAPNGRTLALAAGHRLPRRASDSTDRALDDGGDQADTSGLAALGPEFFDLRNEEAVAEIEAFVQSGLPVLLPLGALPAPPGTFPEVAAAPTAPALDTARGIAESGSRTGVYRFELINGYYGDISTARLPWTLPPADESTYESLLEEFPLDSRDRVIDSRPDSANRDAPSFVDEMPAFLATQFHIDDSRDDDVFSSGETRTVDGDLEPIVSAFGDVFAGMDARAATDPGSDGGMHAMPPPGGGMAPGFVALDPSLALSMILVAPDTPGDVFTTSAANGAGLDFTINGAGAFSGFTLPVDPLPNLGIGDAAVADLSGRNNWQVLRWTSGTPTEEIGASIGPLGANQGAHIAIIPAFVDVPASGGATYALRGATAPTYAGGETAPGSFDGALGVSFDGPGTRVGLEGTVTMPDATYSFTTTGGAANPSAATPIESQFNATNGDILFDNLATNAPGGAIACPAGDCQTDAQFRFGGPGGAFAGGVYFMQGSAGGSALSGAAVFEKPP